MRLIGQARSSSFSPAAPTADDASELSNLVSPGQAHGTLTPFLDRPMRRNDSPLRHRVPRHDCLRGTNRDATSYAEGMVDEAAARRAVDAVIAEWSKAAGEVVISKVEEQSRAWVVHVASRRWVETRYLLEELIGTCPFVVEKATGQLHQYGSALDEYLRFTAWLDTASGS
jgi:hypothetical protein